MADLNSINKRLCVEELNKRPPASICSNHHGNGLAYRMYLEGYAQYLMELHTNHKIDELAHNSQEDEENDQQQQLPKPLQPLEEIKSWVGPIMPGVDRQQRVRLMRAIFIKPATAEEKEIALESQQMACYDCHVPFVKQFNPKKLKTTYDSARYCHYSGKYYCHECHTGELYIPIPARIIMEWDFEERKVCSSAATYLRSIWHHPMICLSAENPKLYNGVVALHVLRQIRLQLCMLFETCRKCPAMMQLMKLDSTLAQCPAYYYEDTEMVSLSDLYRLYQRQSKLRKDAAKVQTCESLVNHPLLEYIKSVRALFVNHVVKDCRQRCFAAVTRYCDSCNSTTPVYAFDVGTSVVCPTCKRVYHKA
eukprot:PhF_6_TR25123/c0_g1_i2/m.34557